MNGLPESGRARLTRSALPSIAGVVVGVLLVISVSSGIFGGRGSGGAGAPPFWFNLNETGSYHAGGVYVYNFSTTWISNSNLTLGWVQFYVLTGQPNVTANFTVLTTNLTGTLVGQFNSSMSTWRGPASPSNETLLSFGGWVFGSAVKFQPSDRFQLVSAGKLSGYDLNVGMALPNSMEDRGIQVIGL
jgi:hypothetical protein